MVLRPNVGSYYLAYWSGDAWVARNKHYMECSGPLLLAPQLCRTGVVLSFMALVQAAYLKVQHGGMECESLNEALVDALRKDLGTPYPC